MSGAGGSEGVNNDAAQNGEFKKHRSAPPRKKLELRTGVLTAATYIAGQAVGTSFMTHVLT